MVYGVRYKVYDMVRYGTIRYVRGYVKRYVKRHVRTSVNLYARTIIRRAFLRGTRSSTEETFSYWLLRRVEKERIEEGGRSEKAKNIQQRPPERRQPERWHGHMCDRSPALLLLRTSSAQRCSCA